MIILIYFVNGQSFSKTFADFSVFQKFVLQIDSFGLPYSVIITSDESSYIYNK